MHADAVIHTYSHDDSTIILAAETGRDHLYFYHRRHIFSEKEDKSGAISQPIRRMVVLSETGGAKLVAFIITGRDVLFSQES